MEACENDDVSRSRTLDARWSRILVALIMVGAVVGMHHLTSGSCASISDYSTTGSLAELSGHGSHGQGGPHEALHDDGVADGAAPGDQGVPTGAIGGGGLAAAMCLAILLTLGCLRPAGFITLARTRTRRSGDRETPYAQEIVDPPDLHSLSISRT